jgi:hypothetical protein
MRDRHWLGIIGVVICCLAWLAVNADNFPLVYKIITPEFYDAKRACDMLRQKDAVLRKGDQGFHQIAETLKALFAKGPEMEITQIRTMESGVEGAPRTAPSPWVSHLNLEVSFLNSHREIWRLGGIEELIKKRYLSFNLFLWGSVVFGTGLTLSLIAVFMKE